MKASTLRNIIRLATARRATAIRRLEAARLRGDDVRCDQIYSVIAHENDIIDSHTEALRKLSV